jgi:thymidylate synthase
MMQFNFLQGFPILTTKAMNFRAIVGELLGFIRGYSSAADFRKLGCKIWDANANQNEAWLNNVHRQGEDDLGRIYGVQWRRWGTYQLHSYRIYRQVEIDQLATAIHMIQNDPTSRRIIVTAWNPGELDQMALPPCHLLYQFLVSQEKRELNLCMYMRSCDMFLGVPFNISSYALLLALVSRATGYRPGTLTMFLADVHIYENHREQVQLQLSRPPLARPILNLNDVNPHLGTSFIPIVWLESLWPEHIDLDGYYPHPAIKAEMAI